MQYRSEMYSSRVKDLIDRIWDYSEVKYEEFRSAKTLIGDPALLEKAREENRRRTGGRKYECPLPPEVLPLQLREKRRVKG